MERVRDARREGFVRRGLPGTEAARSGASAFECDWIDLEAARMKAYLITMAVLHLVTVGTTLGSASTWDSPRGPLGHGTALFIIASSSCMAAWALWILLS